MKLFHSEPAVRLDNVALTLRSRAGSIEILRGVSLDVAPGQSLAVVGPSGSGKTSLLMVMGGLERPTAGSVYIAGRNLEALGDDELAVLRGRNVGIVFQSFHLVTTMTALENVSLPLEFAGKADAERVARDVLAEVGLSHRLEHYPAELSGGEQQRVAIARALAPDPSLLLADEPTGNLDTRTGEQVFKLLFELQRRRGAALVLVTHDAQLAAACDRRLQMADGCIVNEQVPVA